MKDKSIRIKLIQLITIIILYHITKDNNLFLYASTLSLYNIFLSCFSHITLKDIYKKYNQDYSKLRILKYIILNITVICSLFILLSIFIGDAISIFLNIKNTFLPYLIMGLSIITEPLIKLLLEYLESYNKPKLSNTLLNIYYITESILLLLTSIITIRIIKLPIYISISLLYLPKIFSFVLIATIIFVTLKKINPKTKNKESKINYRKELKEVLTNNNHKSIINLVRNSYYYISIIILYMVLSTRYSYNIELVEKDLTFIYLYGIYIINFIIDIILLLTNIINKKENIIGHIQTVFEKNLIVSIIVGITSPLICKIIFLSNDNYIYLTMLSYLSVFITLYNITFDYIKNKKIIYISLIIGVISKIIITIPLINSLYRMGYNLIYGDIISTMISIFISIIINYVYIKMNNKKEKTIEKILKTLYESILLCIILVILQFIVPIKTDNYIKALLTLILYIALSIILINLKKKKERG